MKSKHYNLPIRKPLKSTALRRLINNDNESAETTSSGKEFQTVTMRTAKKCCLQLNLDSGKNGLKVCPYVRRLHDYERRTNEIKGPYIFLAEHAYIVEVIKAKQSER